MIEMEKICKNCVHWAWDKEIYVTSYEGGIEKVFKACPCRVDAHGVDAALSTVYTHGNSDCQNCASGETDNFEPHPDYLAEIEDDRAYRFNPAKYNGVIAGVDFSAALNALGRL